MRLIGPAALISALVCCAGCPPPEEFTGDAGPPELSVGTGDATFVALEDGDEIELVHGPQGGWHVIVSVRMSGLQPDGATLELVVRDAATDAPLAQITLSLLARRLDREGPSYFKLDNFLIFDVAGPDEIVGRDVIVRARLDGDGFSLEDERALRIVDRLP